jgi:hypothetical protein
LLPVVALDSVRAGIVINKVALKEKQDSAIIEYHLRVSRQCVRREQLVNIVQRTITLILSFPNKGTPLSFLVVVLQYCRETDSASLLIQYPQNYLHSWDQ